MKTIDSRHFLLEIELQREAVPSFEYYPFMLSAIYTLKSLQFNPMATFLVGENGTGKSTLLEAIAVACGFNNVIMGHSSSGLRSR